MSKALLFDVNETLLDLGQLTPLFTRIFRDKTVQQLWFDELLHSSLVCNLTDSYTPFGTLAGSALTKIAQMVNTSITEKAQNEIIGHVRKLPPHPDIIENLNRLQSAGFRLATLTNSSKDMLADQLSHAGIDHFFELQLSVDEVERFKPAPEPYHMAAKRMKVKPEETIMVAAHDWDIQGAMAAGYKGAYIARKQKPYNNSYQKPDISGLDLFEVSDAILNTYSKK